MRRMSFSRESRASPPIDSPDTAMYYSGGCVSRQAPDVRARGTGAGDDGARGRRLDRAANWSQPHALNIGPDPTADEFDHDVCLSQPSAPLSVHVGCATPPW